MTPAAPERSFERGLRCLRSGKTLEALAYFESSLRLEEKAPHPARRARYTSYYGYCLAAALGRHRDGLTLCRRAASSEFFTPDLFLNLGRVHLLMGSKKAAWEALTRGLSLDPDHKELQAEALKLGVRRRPVLPFLDRGHALNKAAGMLASKVESAERPRAEHARRSPAGRRR